jgi:hypothetical protein
MTQMQAQERFEHGALVESWLKEPTFLEPVDESRVAAIVHQTPQVRRWPPQVDLGRFAPMLHATKFVAASVILALTGGLLLNVLPVHPVTDESLVGAETATASPTPTPVTATAALTEPPRLADVTTPIITLPDELPDDVESGTIQTPAGPARWIGLSAGSEDDSIPLPSDILPWGDGIAGWRGHYQELHTTSDGLAWNKPQLPLGGPTGPTLRNAEMAYLDGTYVIVDPRSEQVWMTTDPESEWQALDASALSATLHPGWEAAGRRVGSGPMIIDGQVVFTVESLYRIPRDELGIRLHHTKNLRKLPDGRYVLCGGHRSTCSPEWVLRIKETPEGLVVRRDATGERLGLIEGATLDEVYDGPGGRRVRLFAIEGDRVVELESTASGLGPLQVNGRVTAPGGSEPFLRDGTAASSSPGLSSIASEVPAGRTMDVRKVGDRLEASYPEQYNHVGHTEAAWVSRDGVSWTPMPEGAPADSWIEWVGSGWMATQDVFLASGEDTFERWMYLGGKWVSLSPLGDLAQSPAAYASGIDGVTVIASEQGGRHVWVLTHPEVAE